VNDRALSKVERLSYFTTVQKCGELATAGGYKYFGLEFGKLPHLHRLRVPD
jgi:hypothetical protein